MASIGTLDGARAADYVVRLTELTPAAFVEQFHFTFVLEKEGRSSDRPVFHGLASGGRSTQHVPGWIDGFYSGVAYFDDRRIELASEGVDEAFFRTLGSVLTPGGWLGLAYETLGEDTALLQETRRLLDAGAPAIVTPLGALLHAAGCGYHIRNWYISEGWREGARRLQGYRPVNDASRERRASETAVALREFVAEANDVAACESAKYLLEELKAEGIDM